MSLASQVSALATAIGNTLRDSYKPRLLPAGGTAGQVLAKNTATNYDAGWAAPAGGGGGSTSIYRVLAADLVGANVATAQAVFAGITAITLAANTTYELDEQINITRAAGTTSHTTGISFGGTATLQATGGIEYLAVIGNPTGNVLGPVSAIRGEAAANLVLTAANTVATENLRIRVNGIIRTNAAGTFIPQFQFSAVPGGAPTIRRNSYIKLTAIGAAALTALN